MSKLSRMTRWLVLLSAVGGDIAAAQTARLQGRVFDSLSHRPLAGATVSVVSRTSSTASTSAVNATTDSAGRFTIPGIQPGAYLAGFYHPLLDSLGIQVPPRNIVITDASGAGVVEADLGVPSAAAIHRAICPEIGGPDSTGLFIGHLRDVATGAPLVGAAITARWTMLTVVGSHFQSAVRSVSARSNPSGWFAFCGLPTTAPIDFVATTSSDSSGVFAIQVNARAVTRRDVFVGGRGPGAARGAIVEDERKRPLADAQVAVIGAARSAQTNDKGEFLLGDLPVGTHTLAVRKVGYVPEQRVVDILPNDTTRQQFSLSTVERVLDTVRVTATRVYSRSLEGFNERRKHGLGKFLDEDEIARMNPFETSDVLRRVPLVRVRSSGGESQVVMRSDLGGRDCMPHVWVDGFEMYGMTTDEMDMMTRPGQLEAIEVYTSAILAPPEFAHGFDNCGTIAIWTKDPSRRRGKP